MPHPITIQNDSPDCELLIQLVDSHGASEPFALPPRLAQRLIIMDGKALRLTAGTDPRDSEEDAELAKQVREELAGG